MKNFKEYKELAERYSAITLEEIKKHWRYEWSLPGRNVAKILTKFGSWDCVLCQAVGVTDSFHTINCVLCVYEKPFACQKTSETYEGIDYAETPQLLLQAFRARAKYMKQKIRRIENKK